METRVAIRAMGESDWPDVRDIYRAGLATGLASFETEVPAWERWDESHVTECRLVAVQNGQVVGWAALSPVSSRCVYGGVGEVSVYVGERARGMGVGKLLLLALVEESERAGLWTLQAGMFPENVASVALHKKCGFREVGRRERLGQRNGVWMDVLLLERRSDSVGL